MIFYVKNEILATIISSDLAIEKVRAGVEVFNYETNQLVDENTILSEIEKEHITNEMEGE